MTKTEKRRKLADLLERMHPEDRAKFKESQKKYRPNIDQDIFVASLHVPPRCAKFSG